MKVLQSLLMDMLTNFYGNRCDGADEVFLGLFPC